MPAEKPLILTRDQCRAVDRFAIEQLGIPGIVLMENAGRNAAELIAQWVRRSDRDDRPPRAAIICGKGNNGGDGFVIARHLLGHAWNVTVYLAADPATLTGDAAINYAPLTKLGIDSVRIDAEGIANGFVESWNQCDVLIDALLGTGFTGEVREPLSGIIRTINEVSNALVIAIDVPSGLDADTGQPGGLAVEADRTITFLATKPGFAVPKAKHYTGEITIADIGIPLAMVLVKSSSRSTSS